MGKRRILPIALLSAWLPLANPTTAGQVEVAFEPDEARPTRVVLSSGEAKLVFYRQQWQAMTLRTPRGKEFPATDLFLYNTATEKLDAAYWAAPGNWEAWLSFRRLRQTGKDTPAAVCITGTRNGLEKRVVATVDPDRPVVYVVNTLTATRTPVSVQIDHQLTWFPAEAAHAARLSQIVLDGSEHPMDQNGQAISFACAYLPNRDATLAVVFAPASEQRFGAGAAMHYHTFDKGVQLALPKGQRKLQVGESLEQRYAIYWEDGRKLDDVKAFAARMASGKLNGRFRTPPEPSASLRDYQERVLALDWEQGRAVTVANPAGVGTTSAVVVPVEETAGAAYAVLGPDGRPTWSQADDMDADGAVDEVCFIATVPAGGQARYTLLSRNGEGVEATPAFAMRDEPMGSWTPVRVKPTVSPTRQFGSYALSPHNEKAARDLIATLSDERLMTVLENDRFRLILGRESGLIEGMIPKDLLGYDGSYLREYVAGTGAKGNTRLLAQGPVRTVVEWRGGDSTRRFAVDRNGEVRTVWQQPPRELVLVTGAHPYTFMATGPEDADTVRFSQLLEETRPLPRANDRLCVFGYEGLSLGCVHRGYQALTEEVWLDPGEMMFQVGKQQQEAHNTTVADVRQHVWPVMSKLCRTYLGGACNRLVTLQGRGDSAALTYHIGRRGPSARNVFRRQPLVVAVGPPQNEPTLAPLAALSPVEVNAVESSVTVPRLTPNRFNGWKLRPLVHAKRNPLPGYFTTEVISRLDDPRDLRFWVEAGDWLLEAELLSGPYEFEGITDYRRTDAIGDSARPAVSTVAPHEQTTCLLRVRAKEDTVGAHDLTLRWQGGGRGGALGLRLVVKPEPPFFTQSGGYSLTAESGNAASHFGNIRHRGGPYWLKYYGADGLTPDVEKMLLLRFRQAERRGLLIGEYLMVNQWMSWHFGGAKAYLAAQRELSGMEPDRYVAEIADVFPRVPELDLYRTFIYAADEIWEKIGGYKGRRYMPIGDVAAMYEKILDVFPDTPVYNSFMIHGVDADFHVSLPNDLPFVFFYCGHDEGVAGYARKLIEPRMKLFRQWRADPDLMRAAGTDEPVPQFGFWLSSRLHQDDYRTVRRHCWWLRHNGVDKLAVWALGSWNIVYGGVGDWSAMATRGSDSLILTDRSLAIMDAKEDMALISLCRLLRESAAPGVRAEVDALTSAALEHSQNDEFDRARHEYIEAIGLMRSDLGELLPLDTYRPIEATPLPDPTSDEQGAFKQAQEVPSVTLPKVSGQLRPSPVVDGKLDNAYLEEGAVVEGFFLLDGSARASQPTRVYLARDSENLYLLYQCRESRVGEIRGARTEHDAEVYAEDSVELFIMPDPDVDAYFQFAASCIGTRADCKAEEGRKDFGWDPEWEAAAGKDEHSWWVEMKIPFSILGRVPRAGEMWRMNFARNEKPHRETSSWSCAFGSFHATERFGLVRMGE